MRSYTAYNSGPRRAATRTAVPRRGRPSESIGARNMCASSKSESRDENRHDHRRCERHDTSEPRRQVETVGCRLRAGHLPSATVRLPPGELMRPFPVTAARTTSSHGGSLGDADERSAESPHNVRTSCAARRQRQCCFTYSTVSAIEKGRVVLFSRT